MFCLEGSTRELPFVFFFAHTQKEARRKKSADRMKNWGNTLDAARKKKEEDLGCRRDQQEVNFINLSFHVYLFFLYFSFFFPAQFFFLIFARVFFFNHFFVVIYFFFCIFLLSRGGCCRYLFPPKEPACFCVGVI